MRMRGNGKPDFRRKFYWGYDRGYRTSSVECCGKELLSRVAYEQHMKGKHPRRVRQMKKDGRWQQDRLEGWTSMRKKK